MNILNPRISVPLVLLGFGLAWGGGGCSSLPEPKINKHEFPRDAFIETPKDRKFEKLGIVKTKVNFPSLSASLETPWTDDSLCENYFNKAAANLIKESKKKGGDAVMEVRSVVFLMDGKRETHKKAECSDDGQEGQVLAQGEAIKWVKEP